MSPKKSGRNLSFEPDRLRRDLVVVATLNKAGRDMHLVASIGCANWSEDDEANPRAIQSIPPQSVLSPLRAKIDSKSSQSSIQDTINATCVSICDWHMASASGLRRRISARAARVRACQPQDAADRVGSNSCRCGFTASRL